MRGAKGNTALIHDDPSFGEVASSGQAAWYSMRVANAELYGLKIREGHIVVRSGYALPVIRGQTASSLFGESAPHKYEAILREPIQTAGQLTHGVFIPGSSNYYHFLVFHLPTLFLLRTSEQTRVSLITMSDFPASISALILKLLPTFSQGRPVDIRKVVEGDYEVGDVMFAVRPALALAVTTCRQVILPFVLSLAGLADPVHELGGIKLFLRRTNANGRNLVNQAEIEDWLARRDYLPVDPGLLTIEEQVILFARATHIVGVEGAAFANLLFAVAAQEAIVLANPVTADENFLPPLAEACGVAIKVISGDAPPKSTSRLHRGMDFFMPLERLEASLL